ncbi:hypothetical protein [Streptomyces abikoensis]|uniref:DUF222 domain-containing protein n=1 Tax=Streptomyces abikoensis TaxID=97398 RepID=A0ABW7T716_9ACTN
MTSTHPTSPGEATPATQHRPDSQFATGGQARTYGDGREGRPVRSTDAFGRPIRQAAIQVMLGNTARAFRELTDAGRVYIERADQGPLLDLAQRIVDAGDACALGAYIAEHLLSMRADIFIPDDCKGVVKSALQGLRLGTDGLVEDTLPLLERTNPDALVELIAMLGANLAHNDPYGARGPLILDAETLEPSAEPDSWMPDPRQIPEWRRKLLSDYRSENAPSWMGATLANGHYVLAPALEDAVAAGAVLCDQEAERLSKAKLYYADARTCAVAARKASQPRTAPLVGHRIPSTYGLVVFATPIAGKPGEKPTVAASWGRWNSDRDGLWAARRNGVTTPLFLADGSRWWITFYSPTSSPIGAPVRWDTEGLVVEGQTWEEDSGTAPVPKDRDELALRTVIATWDLITQERVAKAVTSTEEIVRKPVRVRSDRRRGIEDNGTVRLVSIRGRRAPDGRRPAPRPDGDAPSRAYRSQWMVYEHSRNHCMNPHLHSQKGCTHEDITILDFIKGPEGAPFVDRVTSVKA